MKTYNPYSFVTYVPLAGRYSVSLPVAGRHHPRVLGSYPTLSEAMLRRDDALASAPIPFTSERHHENQANLA